jgi:hypothetical protein
VKSLLWQRDVPSRRDKRLAFAEATFLLHPLALVTPSGALLEVNDLRHKRTELERGCGPQTLMIELDKGIAKLDREELQVQKVFEERTSLTGPEIRALMQGHTSLSATDALPWASFTK